MAGHRHSHDLTDILQAPVARSGDSIRVSQPTQTKPAVVRVVTRDERDPPFERDTGEETSSWRSVPRFGDDIHHS